MFHHKPLISFFVKCPTEKSRKIFIAVPQLESPDLLEDSMTSKNFSVQCEHCKEDHEYAVRDIKATRRGPSNIWICVAIGALLGLLLGPIGVLIGGLAGLAFGAYEDSKENATVNRFNRIQERRKKRKVKA